MHATYPKVSDISIHGRFYDSFAEILTEDALIFLKRLHIKFDSKRKSLLEKRQVRQSRIDQGELPDFLEDTADIRSSSWKVAPIPTDLEDRRVEITGPVNRKMVINALNSGAKVFMADFEDSNTPSWENTIKGQINLRDANTGKISFTNPHNQKYYELKDNPATLMVRPRGWHLEERHIQVHGQPISASLVDFGLYVFHNTHTLIKKGSGPYFYLPKLESHLEARLWNEVFIFAQNYLDIPQKTIKATVLIETILAAFEIDEILYELRDHSAGLNCGRWDYIFSFIKKFKSLPGYTLPDRAKVDMKTHFMSSYSKLVVQTCHKRGIHAMGGMAAQIPIKNNTVANEKAFQKVKKDKLQEVRNGHDGTWVAHPGLVPVAMEIFNKYMPEKNQINKKIEARDISSGDLLRVPLGTISERGLRNNIQIGILYIESWLSGNGAAAINHLMEDAATAEISRTQVWQWLKNQSTLEDGRSITISLYESILLEEIRAIKNMKGDENYDNGRFEEAIELFDELVTNEEFIDFLTIPAYQLI